MSNNETDKKVTIKRRGDGVYDIYVNDKLVESKGSARSASEFVEAVLSEDFK